MLRRGIPRRESVVSGDPGGSVDGDCVEAKTGLVGSAMSDHETFWRSELSQQGRSEADECNKWSPGDPTERSFSFLLSPSLSLFLLSPSLSLFLGRERVATYFHT